MEMESEDLYCENERPCLKLVNINSSISRYFDSCWMKIDPTSESSIVHSTDPSIVLSDGQGIIQGIVYMILSIAGATLNFLVILAIYKSSELRRSYLTPTILSLALGDFVFSIYIIPALSLRGFTKDSPLPQGCAFHGFIAFTLWELSACNLVCLAILRCFRQTKSLTPTQKQWFKHASKILPVMAWGFAFLTAIPELMGQYGRYGLECKKFFCVVVDVDKENKQLPSHPLHLFMGLILTKGAVSTVLNLITFVQVQRKTRKLFKAIIDANPEKSLKFVYQERRLGIMAMIITASFFLVYCPHIILLYIRPNAEITNPWASMVTTFLACSLVIIDPIIYTNAQEKYQEEIREILNNAYEFITSIWKNRNKTESNVTLNEP